MKKQQGLVMVEFALIAPVFFILIFGALEVARLLFVLNTLTEVTRRGARTAVVCPVDKESDYVRGVAIFGGDGSGTSPILNGLKDEHIIITYFDDTGGTYTKYDELISAVSVKVVNYEHTLLIPFITTNITLPEFETTLPVESLGWIPYLDVRQCTVP